MAALRDDDGNVTACAYVPKSKRAVVQECTD